MTNLSLGIVPLIFTVISVPMFIQSILRRKDNKSSIYYALMCASNALWAFLQAMFYFVPNENAAVIFLESRLAFVCCSSIFTYLFVLNLFQHRMLNKNITASILIIPAVTLLIALTNRWHGLMRTHIRITYVSGVRAISYSNGIWFWIHCAVCYAFIALAAKLVIQRLWRLPSGYRTPVSIMLCGVALTAAASLVSAFNLVPLTFDIAPVVTQISQILYFYALFNAHSMDVLFMSRDTIFENTGYPVFILNLDGRIMDYNHNAAKMAFRLGFKKPYNVSYPKLLQKWMEAYSGRVFEEDSSIVTIDQDGSDTHFQVISNNILGASGKKIGSYIELKNITPIMSLIHKLQDSANYDQLTGLPNRRSFVQKRRELSCMEYLPLGIISGDVNELKKVNDTYLHATGDMLLKAITEILQRFSPSKTMWFRVGGDEFVGLVPNTCDEEMQKIIDAIQQNSSELDNPKFLDADIAAAYTIMTDPGQDIDFFLQQADRAMYSDKRDRRRRE